MQKLLRFVLFSNLFYCLCAVALAIETVLVFKLENIPFLFWPLLVIVVFLYYGYAYWQGANANGNIRSQWYYHYKAVITKIIYACLTLMICLSIILLSMSTASPSIVDLCWVASIPLLALAYYGVYYKSKKYALRSITILKPIVIGYVWSGAVVLVPTIVNTMFGGQIGGRVSMLNYFINTWWLISLLALLFDIKDFEEDENLALQTLVTKFGIEKTINKIVLPGLIIFSCSYFVLNYNYTNVSLVLASVIFCFAAILVGVGTLRKQNITYYLLLIDGLMLLKALIGITLALAH